MTTIRRVAVTGMGAICGLGHNLADTWNALIEGQSGITRIEKIPTENLPVDIAGEVKNFQISEELLSAKNAARNDIFIHYALHSTDEAIKQAGLLSSGYKPEKIGAILGVGMGGFPYMENTFKEYLQKGRKRISPFFITSVIPNMASGLISIHYGFKGTNYTISSACASSAHAISAAAYEIMLGKHDAIITGGSESVICDTAICGFAHMKALAKDHDHPSKASRPFDLNRNGFVMAEGSGILILEDMEKAKARGAKILAEIVGHSATADALHITAPHPEGEGATTCMKQAIESAGINIKEIGYINAHGTATSLGDIAETKAIKSIFGNHASKINISSTKSMTGHLLGAAGGLETIICIKALQEGIIPPTINLDTPDPQCDLNYTPNHSQKREIEYALNNSFGFGGTNSCIILKKYKG